MQRTTLNDPCRREYIFDGSAANTEKIIAVIVAIVLIVFMFPVIVYVMIGVLSLFIVVAILYPIVSLYDYLAAKLKRRGNAIFRTKSR